VREHAANSLVKAAADGLLRYTELRESVRPAGVHLGQALLDEIQGRRGRVGLKVRPGPIPFQRVAPARDLPLELDLRKCRRLGQANLDAVPGRLDRADVIDSGLRRHPEAGE